MFIIRNWKLAWIGSLKMFYNTGTCPQTPKSVSCIGSSKLIDHLIEKLITINIGTKSNNFIRSFQSLDYLILLKFRLLSTQWKVKWKTITKRIWLMTFLFFIFSFFWNVNKMRCVWGLDIATVNHCFLQFHWENK